MESKKRNGSPKLVTKHEKRTIIRKILKNPKLSALKLTIEFREETKKEVSVETIRRVLREKNYHGQIARRKPYINEINRKYRLEFANEHLLKDANWWWNVIF